MDEPVQDPAHDHPTHDPMEDPVGSPRGARALTVASFVLGLIAIAQLPLLFGPMGMVCGLLAHVKGDRPGFAGAVFSGITTVLGMSLLFLFDNPFQR